MKYMNNNIITRQEVAENLSNQMLKFNFYAGNRFVFMGTDSFDNMIMMFIVNTAICYAPNNLIIRVHDFIDLDERFVNFMIIDKNLEVIYQD